MYEVRTSVVIVLYAGSKFD